MLQYSVKYLQNRWHFNSTHFVMHTIGATFVSSGSVIFDSYLQGVLWSKPREMKWPGEHVEPEQMFGIHIGKMLVHVAVPYYLNQNHIMM